MAVLPAEVVAAVAAVEVAVVVVVVANFQDRVGLGWRPEIAVQIMANLEHIDTLEVLADNYFAAPNKSIQAVQFLARQIPVSLHGVGMGLASSLPVATSHLEKMARLVNRVEPEYWSEHLAFVRAGTIEIGHLAAPPRNRETISGALQNIAAARRIVGSLPHLENIATLLEPPGSPLSEPAWISEIILNSGAPLLLDLHNLYANAVNFSADPQTLLAQLPLGRVASVHLSGGRWIAEPTGGGRRLLDDHLHDVPAELFALLAQVGQSATQSLTVIIERDGNFPSFDVLREQMRLARLALQQGRAAAVQGAAP